MFDGSAFLLVQGRCIHRVSFDSCNSHAVSDTIVGQGCPDCPRFQQNPRSCCHQREGWTDQSQIGGSAVNPVARSTRRSGVSPPKIAVYHTFWILGFRTTSIKWTIPYPIPMDGFHPHPFQRAAFQQGFSRGKALRATVESAVFNAELQ